MCAVLAAAAASGANADILWTFNSLPTDNAFATGTLIPEMGAGTAGLFGGVTSTFASGNASGGSTDPELSSNDSGWNLSGWAPQGTDSGLRGAEFAASTAGLFANILVTFDGRHSNSMSRFIQVSYDLGDGNGFRTTGLTGAGILEADLGGDRWYNGRSIQIPATAANNPGFKFRIASIFAPSTSVYATATSTTVYGTTGTLRLDMVRLSGEIPTPGSAVLLGLGGLVATRRRRA